jgi:hypothetical protein
MEVRYDRLPLKKDGEALDWRSDAPTSCGVYAFWWRRGARQFFHSIRNRTLHFTGPGGVPHDLPVTMSLLLTAPNGYLPLYVGKTAGSIARRVGQHLMLGTERTVKRADAYLVSARRTTTNQVRDRLDRLFPEEPDTRPMALENLMLSYVELTEFYDRFFLENLAVGTLRPLFNVDSER